MKEATLVKKVKIRKNKLQYAGFGCSGYPKHKTNKSKHCLYYNLCGAALDAAKTEYLYKNNNLYLAVNKKRMY